MSPVRFPKPVSGRIDPKASSERPATADRPKRPDRAPGERPAPAGRGRPHGDRPASARRERDSDDRPASAKRDRDFGDRPASARRERDFGDRSAPAKRDRPTPPRKERAEERPVEDDGFIPLVEGAPAVLDLLETAPERVDAVFLRKGRHSKDMDRIADLCRSGGVRFNLLEADAFARACPGARGAAARIFQAGYVPLERLLETIMDAPLPLVVALDQVQDPGNAGTLARTLYALGGAGLIVPRHNGVYLGAAAFKAASGALALLPVAKCANLGQALDQAEKLGITIYGAAMEGKGEAPLHDILSFTPRLPAVLVLGGEESGLRPGVEKRCDALLRVPMLRPFNSLNVAQAGAILAAHFLRSRKE